MASVFRYKNEFQLVLNARCGCTATKKWLLEREAPYRHDFKTVHVAARKFVVEIPGGKNQGSLFTVMITRNPYDRIASTWLHKFGYNRFSFEDFFNNIVKKGEDSHWNPQYIAADGLRIDKFIDVVDLSVGLADIESSLGLRHVPVERLNASGVTHQFTDLQKEMVREFYKEDFARYYPNLP